MKKLLQFALLILISCTTTKPIQLPEAGKWRLHITSPGGVIPALFELNYQNAKPVFTLFNGPDRITLPAEINQKNQLIIPMQIFNTRLILDQVSQKEMKGIWQRLDKTPVQEYAVTFQYNQSNLFDENEDAKFNISGKWKLIFDPGTKDEEVTLGIFKQNKNKVTGTILTTTGDYRYLEGIISKNTLFLSTFDGAFAYLIKADFDGKELKGTFYTARASQPFVATKVFKNILPEATTLTKIKKDQTFSFSFPDLEGNLVSLSDQRFKNKPLIVSIYGSWCPNCMDETAFLTKWYEKNDSKDIQLVTLAFERSASMSQAIANVKKSIDFFKAKHLFLMASATSSGKPADLLSLEGVISFPTMIFLDRKHQVVKIHTGFAGPATGVEYQKFILMFEKIIKSLL